MNRIAQTTAVPSKNQTSQKKRLIFDMTKRKAAHNLHSQSVIHNTSDIIENDQPSEIAKPDLINPYLAALGGPSQPQFISGMFINELESAISHTFPQGI
jgi:1-deoxy-D-xylulose 5-phosphate reductoisomerase